MQTAVKSALEVHFQENFAQTAFSPLRVQYSTVDFDTRRVDKWVRFTFLPSTSRRISIGGRGVSDVEHRGDVVLNLFFPLRSRDGSIFEFADAVSPIFDRAVICVGELTVTFDAPTITNRPDIPNRQSVDIRTPYRYFSR